MGSDPSARSKSARSSASIQPSSKLLSFQTVPVDSGNSNCLTPVKTLSERQDGSKGRDGVLDRVARTRTFSSRSKSGDVDAERHGAF